MQKPHDFLRFLTLTCFRNKLPGRVYLTPVIVPERVLGSYTDWPEPTADAAVSLCGKGVSRVPLGPAAPPSSLAPELLS
jgi:hypothetical protein